MQEDVEYSNLKIDAECRWTKERPFASSLLTEVSTINFLSESFVTHFAFGERKTFEEARSSNLLALR